MIEQPTPDKEAHVSASVAPVVRPLSSRQRRRLQATLDAERRAGQRVIDVIRELCSVEGASVQAIAAELGITRQAVYKRLRSTPESDRPSRSKVSK